MIIISYCKQISRFIFNMSFLTGSKPIHCHIMPRNRNLESFLCVACLSLLGIGFPQILNIIGNDIE